MQHPMPRPALRRTQVLATLLSVLFASVVAGWVFTSPAVSEPAVAPTEPAVIELRPPAAHPHLSIPMRIAADVSAATAISQMVSESRCLAEVMYFEARGEGEAGQVAVAAVIMNRLAAGDHGRTICSVVYEGAGQTFCQFTFACDGSRDKAKLPEPWRASQVLAVRLLAGEVPAPPQTQGATYYHSAMVTPSWDSKMVRTGQVGNHVFFRLPPLRPSLIDAAFRGSLQ
jgi:spore germination cell wall hydrolase CwlJ-like protein